VTECIEALYSIKSNPAGTSLPVGAEEALRGLWKRRRWVCWTELEKLNRQDARINSIFFSFLAFLASLAVQSHFFGCGSGPRCKVLDQGFIRTGANKRETGRLWALSR